MNKNKRSFGIAATSIFSKYGIYLILLILVVIMSFAQDKFMTPNNILNLLRQVSITGGIALGMCFVIASGGIDLSAGSVVALASVVGVTFAKGGYPLIVPVVVTIAVAMLCGAVNGVLIAKTGITPFIITLGMTQVARGAAMLFTDGRPQNNFIESFKFIGQGYKLGVPMPIYFFVLLIVICYIALHRARYGRHLLATGGNPIAAKVSGINTDSVIIRAYILEGILVGISAIIFVARTGTASPGYADGYELDAIAACAIGGVSMSGGRATILGTVIGALIIGVINNGLNLLNVSSYIQYVVKGTIIILAVLLDKMTSEKAAKIAAIQANS